MKPTPTPSRRRQDLPGHGEAVQRSRHQPVRTRHRPRRQAQGRLHPLGAWHVGSPVIARALAVGIICAPFISALLLGLARAGRALRTAIHRPRSSR